jgi:hypothetical protein
LRVLGEAAAVPAFVVAPVEIAPGIARAVAAMYPGVTFLAPTRQPAELVA